MKTRLLMIGSLLMFFLCVVIAQETTENNEYYSDCAAIFFKGEMLVDEYSPSGKCKLEQGMEGTLSLSAVELNDLGGKPTKKLSFQIAIKNPKTNTLYMYSDKVFESVQLEDILKKCTVGDHIIFLTTDQRYNLAHHEIEIVWGC